MRLQLRCGNFIFDTRFDNNGNNTLLVGDSILFDFEQGTLPIDVLALRGGRTSDLHDLYSLMGSYDRVVLLIGGNDLDDWRKRNVDGDSELRPGRSSTWIANQLAEISETLWNRHKTAVHICSILPRLKRVNGFFEIVSEISEINQDLRKRAEHPCCCFRYMGLSSYFHQVNQTIDGIHWPGMKLVSLRSALHVKLFN